MVDHFIQSGALEHYRSAKDTVPHLVYWKSRLGEYALVYLTPERLGKERQLLIDTSTPQNTKKSPATVNRYIASLSSCLSYACRQLRWIDDNPCFNLIKLKEASGRDRVLTQEEVSRLFKACRESRNDYLFCIVLFAFTTGMRQGEILNLTWNDVDLENRLAHLKETKNGTAGKAFIKELVYNKSKHLERIKRFIERFKEANTPLAADGQVLCVLNRFALIAAAGTLATELGISGWIEEDAIWASKQCFDSWLKTRGGISAQEGH